MLTINVRDTLWQDPRTVWAGGRARQRSSSDGAWPLGACCWSHVCAGLHVQLGGRRTGGGEYRPSPRKGWGVGEEKRERE